jgi:S-adenosylmethionine/arginine decarboxylase-like enzyme
MSQISHLNHKHVIFKAKLSNPPTTELQIHRWIEAIVPEIGMEFFMGPYVKKSDLEGNKGITGVAIITTSHICLHTFDNDDGTSDLQLDVYSCKCFEKQIIIDSLKVLYGAHDFEILELDRNNNLKIEGKSMVSTNYGPSELLYWGT